MFSRAALMVVLAASIAAARIGAHPSSSERVAEAFSPRRLLVGSEVRRVAAQDERGQPLAFPNPVSTSHFRGEQYFVCNYADIAIIDLHSGRGHIIAKPPGVDAWHPTAVCWAPRSRRLYVANYTGKDVLVLSLTPDGRFELRARWHGPHLAGPEGVAVDDTGTRVAIADHDGNRLVVVDAEGSVCGSTPIPNCHGVAFLPDGRGIAATGLGDASVQICSRDGVPRARRIRHGWHTGQFLWPTTVSISPRGSMLIADAHTGMLTELDANLDASRSMGGNGVDESLFNLPYAASWIDPQRVLVTDTFKARLLEVDAVEQRVNRIVTFAPEAGWESALPVAPSHVTDTGLPLQGEGFRRWDSAITARLAFPILGNGGRFWTLSYGGMTGEDGRFMRADPLAALYSSSYFYFQFVCYGRAGDRAYAILASPQAPRAVVIDLERGAAVSIALSGNVWHVGDRLVDGTAGVAVNDVVALADARLSSYRAALAADGDRLAAMRIHLFGAIDDATFRSRFTASFVTPAGQRFAARVLHDPSPPAVQAAADDYGREIANERQLVLPELLLVDTLR